MIGCGSDGGKDGGKKPGSGPSEGATLTVPKVYPPVRAATPSGLIKDPQYANKLNASASAARASRIGVLPQALGGAVNLALAVQERLYSPGPTSVLRIVSELDGQTARLNTDTAMHPCLASEPVEKTYSLPGGQTFRVKLQCMETLAIAEGGEQFIAIGFAEALPEAPGPDAAVEVDAAVSSATDFYLVHGQTGGMGGAYHVDIATGRVEAWISVADSRAPMNSQVIMHLLADKQSSTLELAFGGSGVGFCAAHLKASKDRIVVRGKTNGAPPLGTPMEMITPDTQYCDDERTGCFDTGALDPELAMDAPGCSDVGVSKFELSGVIDATPGSGNVTPSKIYKFFEERPTGVMSF